MSTKKGDLLNLWYIFEGLKFKKQNVKFSYFVAKNKIKMKSEVDALTEAQEAPEVFKAYDGKRADLAAEMADRVADTDQPLVDNGQYVIKARKDEFDKQLAELKEEYKSVIEDRAEQVEKFKELLDEEVKFDGHKIKLGDIPQEIEPSVLEAFIAVDLINEEE